MTFAALFSIPLDKYQVFWDVDWQIVTDISKGCSANIFRVMQSKKKRSAGA
jgi:hypothetical protein